MNQSNRGTHLVACVVLYMKWYQSILHSYFNWMSEDDCLSEIAYH